MKKRAVKPGLIDEIGDALLAHGFLADEITVLQKRVLWRMRIDELVNILKQEQDGKICCVVCGKYLPSFDDMVDDNNWHRTKKNDRWFYWTGGGVCESCAPGGFENVKTWAVTRLGQKY